MLIDLRVTFKVAEDNFCTLEMPDEVFSNVSVTLDLERCWSVELEDFKHQVCFGECS